MNKPTKVVRFWRDYLREQRAARRFGMSFETPGQYTQRTVPPKRGKGSYSRKGKIGC